MKSVEDVTVAGKQLKISYSDKTSKLISLPSPGVHGPVISIHREQRTRPGFFWFVHVVTYADGTTEELNLS